MIEPIRYGGRYYQPRQDLWPDAARYRITGWVAVAVCVVGELLEVVHPDDECGEPEFEGTGLVGVVSVGDDYAHPVDPARLVRIGRGDYCGQCGQLGCGHGAGADDDDDDEGGEV